MADFSADLNSTYLRLRHGLASNSRGYEWRIRQLEALRRLVNDNDDRISKAMWADLRKSQFECEATEQGIVLAEIADALKNLKRWMKPRRVRTPLYNQLGNSHIVHDPYGLTLIIGAWNYPVNLTLAPLVGAIAGGNAAIIKPSEISAHTGELLGELIPKYLDPELFAVVQGGPQETSLLLDKQFDLIFFTGSGPVGKIILAKAAPHLTPVVLELGGKSPAVIQKEADLRVSARRIAWGKFMNAGQTCVAPDYVIVHPEIRESFLSEMKQALREFYGDDASQSPDYCRIINQRNFDRLLALMRDTRVLQGGKSDRATNYIEPTLLSAHANAPVMQEEIFGPLLPVLEMSDVEEIITFINSRPKPLALYVFTKSEDCIRHFAERTSSGGFVVNDVVIHMPVPELPFGGVGASGMGHYHGEFSFKTFTHAKGVLRKSLWFDVPVRYPPYTKRKAKILKWLFS